LEGFSELTRQLSLENLLHGDFSGVISVLYLALLIAIYSIIIWHFYRFIARRDCFKPSKRKHTKAVGFLKYFCLFPLIAIIFFIGFALMLLFLAKDIDVDVILSTSFAIILAIRITSYYSIDLSKDVAKMLPFALLGVFLVSPNYFNMNVVMEKINSIPDFLILCIQFIFFIVLVEWILRIMLTIRYKLLPKKVKPMEETTE
jgi:hypothetical protein